MSWVPAAGGLREPTTRTAPRPQAASSTFTFGQYDEKVAQQSQEEQKRGSPALGSPASPGTRGACYDEPAEKLRWWTDAGRPNATITAMRNSDVESFWRDAKQDIKARVGELVNANAARMNKEVALGSNLKKAMQDAEPPSFASNASSYKQDFCGTHERVGRRAVVHSPEAMQAFLASKDQARQNKSVGRGTNLTLAQF